MRLFYKAIFSAVFCWIAAESGAADHASPRAIGTCSAVDELIGRAIDERVFPGAQLAVGDSRGVIYARTYGYQDYSKNREVQADDLYDIASCTKVMASTLAVMKLVGDGALHLTDSIGGLLPEYCGTTVSRLTLAELLKHTTGLRSGIPVVQRLVRPETGSLFSTRKSESHPYRYDRNLYACGKTRYDTAYLSPEPCPGFHPVADRLYASDSIVRLVDSMVLAAHNPLRRGRYLYSDLNFYFVQKMVEAVTGESLDAYVRKLYDRMDIRNIGYNPVVWKPKEKIVPTEYDCLLRKDTLRGYVHDEFAWIRGGVSGNAGLFADAASLGVVCRMLLDSGRCGSARIIRPEVIEEFTRSQIPGGKVCRGLGFAKQPAEATEYGPESYGHTGFTGTFFWVDPERDIYVVLLTNRVYPSRCNKQFDSAFRRELWEKVVASVQAGEGRDMAESR